MAPQHELVDEEICPEDDPSLFYQANPGDILASHYQLLVKIGWGTRSTVWLARDIARFEHLCLPCHYGIANRSRFQWQSERTVPLK